MLALNNDAVLCIARVDAQTMFKIRRINRHYRDLLDSLADKSAIQKILNVEVDIVDRVDECERLILNYDAISILHLFDNPRVGPQICDVLFSRCDVWLWICEDVLFTVMLHNKVSELVSDNISHNVVKLYITSNTPAALKVLFLIEKDKHCVVHYACLRASDCILKGFLSSFDTWDTEDASDYMVYLHEGMMHQASTDDVLKQEYYRLGAFIIQIAEDRFGQFELVPPFNSAIMFRFMVRCRQEMWK